MYGLWEKKYRHSNRIHRYTCTLYIYNIAIAHLASAASVQASDVLLLYTGKQW